MPAASALTASSNLSGPSTRPPEICPRSAILHRAAASKAEGIFLVMFSTAERIATLASSKRRTFARSIAFRQMSRLRLAGERKRSCEATERQEAAPGGSRGGKGLTQGVGGRGSDTEPIGRVDPNNGCASGDERH